MLGKFFFRCYIFLFREGFKRQTTRKKNNVRQPAAVLINIVSYKYRTLGWCGLPCDFCVVWIVVRNWMIVDGTLSPVCQQNMAIIQSDEFDTLAWFWVTPFNPNAHHHRILCEDNVLVCLSDCLPVGRLPFDNSKKRVNDICQSCCNSISNGKTPHQTIRPATKCH